MKNKTLQKFVAGAGLGIVAALVAWVLYVYIAPDLLYTYEARTYDWRISKKIEDVPDQSIEEIIVVDIDGRSVSELGKFSQWPRSYYPRVINYLNEGGALAVGLDIIFDKDIRDPQADVDFVNAVANAGNVFNAVYFAFADSLNFRYVMNSEPAGMQWEKFAYQIDPEISQNFIHEERLENEFIDLLNASRAVGHVNFKGDVDGVVRKIYLYTNFNDHSYPSLAFKMFSDIMGVDSMNIDLGNRLTLFSENSPVTSIPVDLNGNMVINYFGRFKTFRYVSFYDVLEQRIPKEFFENKIILVGTSLPGLFDLRSVPFQPAFPGVEIHANILMTLLTGQYVTQLTGWENLVLLLGIGLTAGIITVFLTPLWSILVVLLFGAIHTFAAALLFLEMNIWVPMVIPFITLFLTFSLVYTYKYITEERGKNFIRKTFSHFVTQSVVDELLANPEKIKLGGERKVCTVFFSDVAGFTTISEQMTPEALVSLLNEYLTQMTNIVFEYDGMLDKYEGDAIMAVFGAPIAHGNHAARCCAAALEMQEQLEKMRKMWQKQGKPQLKARCGINTGPMVVGNMGSENRFDYTVMGDSVNLGARLEPANKEYGTEIMIGENTYEMAKEEIIARELDLLRVKGKTEPVKVYELVGMKDKGIPERKAQLLESFSKGFDNYLAQNWDWAINYFKQALAIDPLDGPAKRYVDRCNQFKENPPGSDWDGVFTMKTK